MAQVVRAGSSLWGERSLGHCQTEVVAGSASMESNIEISPNPGGEPPSKPAWQVPLPGINPQKQSHEFKRMTYQLPSLHTGRQQFIGPMVDDRIQAEEWAAGKEYAALREKACS